MCSTDYNQKHKSEVVLRASPLSYKSFGLGGKEAETLSRDHWLNYVLMEGGEGDALRDIDATVEPHPQAHETG